MQVISAAFQATQGGIMPQLLGPEKILAAFREYLKASEFPNADKLIPDEERVLWLAAMEDAERSATLLTQTMQMEQGGGQQGAQQGGGQARSKQAQPQQAAKQAGMGRESGVEARRGAA